MELKKCSNIPALQQGDAIPQALQGITRRLDAIDKRLDGLDKRFDAMDKRFDAVDKRFDAMDKRFDAVDRRFDVMDARIQSNEHNSIARLQNRMLHYPDDVLAPLHDSKNDIIDQFPQTPRAIQNMRGSSLDTVLRVLGSEAGGSVDKKRSTIRLLVGLPTDIP